MPNTKTKTMTVEQAEADLTAVTAETGRLRAAVLDGDSTITAGTLAAANEAVALATLRLEGAQNAAAVEAERVRLDRIAQLTEFVRANFGTGDEALLGIFEDAVGALVPLVEAVTARNDGLAAIAAEARATGTTGDSSRNRVVVQDGSIRLPDLDLSFDQLDAVTLLAEAGFRAATAAGLTVVASKLVPLAGVTFDHATSTHLGVAPRADGAPQAAGMSDRIRRSAAIVVEHAGA